MDTVNSNDYMKINWAENGTTEYKYLKKQKYIGNLIGWKEGTIKVQLDNNTSLLQC